MDSKRTFRPPGPAPLRGPAGPTSPARPGLAARPGAAGPAAAARRSGMAEDIDRLDREVQQLRIEFERFFSGAQPLPPEELRHRIQGQLRQLRNRTATTAVEGFRLGELEARFNSYNELFNRRLRDREEGRHAPRIAPPAPAAPRFDPEQGIVVREAVDPAAAEALYTGLRSGSGEGPKFDLDSFQTYLERQAASIREKTGCAQVQFRLAREDGKLKLKARPVGT
jgi:hypothetical protein